MGAALANGAGCDRGTAGSAPAAAGPSTDGRSSADLTRREYLDAVRAIESYLAVGRAREAEIVARRMLVVAADGPFARGAEGQAARVLVARADLDDGLSARERRDLVLEAARLARSSVGELADPADLSIDSIRFAALLADRIGDRDGALELYEAALAARPDDVATLLPAALSALVRDPGDPRLDAFVERHERLAPDAAWSAGLRAELLLARGEAAAALPAAEEALRRGREQVEMRLILAKALRANGRAVDAARLLQALPGPERAKAPIALELARALARVESHAAAAEALALAIASSPDEPFLRAEAAIAFSRAGASSRAAAELAALAAMPGADAEHARAAQAVAELLRQRTSGLEPDTRADAP